MFAYKHTETKEYVKKYRTFKKKYKLHGNSTILWFKNAKFSGIVFIWSRSYNEIFKSTLVYLQATICKP